MTSDPDHVRDEEIVTDRGEGPADPARQRDADSTDTGDATDQAGITAPSGASDTGVMMDPADTGTADVADVLAPGGATDTGVMMDAADAGTLDQADVAAPSGATDTGMMMDSRDTGTIDRTDVGEPDADADESDR
jgi:hypothetical protein